MFPMKVAVPVFNDRLSPRLDVADYLYVYSVEQKKIEKFEKVRLQICDPVELIALLQRLKVFTIICSGCPQYTLRLLSIYKIKVYYGFCCDLNYIENALESGDIDQTFKLSRKTGGRHRNNCRQNRS